MNGRVGRGSRLVSGRQFEASLGKLGGAEGAGCVLCKGWCHKDQGRDLLFR